MGYLKLWIDVGSTPIEIDFPCPGVYVYVHMGFPASFAS